MSICSILASSPQSQYRYLPPQGQQIKYYFGKDSYSLIYVFDRLYHKIHHIKDLNEFNEAMPLPVLFMKGNS